MFIGAVHVQFWIESMRPLEKYFGRKHDAVPNARLFDSAHLMRRDARGVALAGVAGALLLVGVVFPRPSSAPVNSSPAPSIRVSAASQAPPASLTPVEEMERRVFDLTNGERTRVGLRRLGREAVLATAARVHSEDMLRRGFFDHVNPDGQSPADRVARIAGPSAGTIGENIWMWSGSISPPLHALVEQAVAGWMARLRASPILATW